jgi:very-short-patch-repair endonuclease
VGRRGTPQLVRLVREATRGTRSEAERVLVGHLRRAGIRGWVAGAPLRLRDGTLVELDLWFPAARVVVEVDGKAWHVDDERFQRDRVRQNALVTAGCTVLRFTWYDLARAPDRVVATVRAALDRVMIANRGQTPVVSGPTGP